MSYELKYIFLLATTELEVCKILKHKMIKNGSLILIPFLKSVICNIVIR